MQKKDVRIEDRYIKWFSALHFKDVKEVGGKAANLGEMYNIGIPVPQGFAVLASAYQHFLEVTGLKEKIYSILNNLNIDNTKELDEASAKIKQMIISAEMPRDLEMEIIESYDLFNSSIDDIPNVSSNVLKILKTARESVFVAVRSSATAEDSAEASFSGQQETFLNVKGKSELIESVKKCWASLFTPRSIYYRIKKGFKHESVLIAVVVQIMINSDKSGVIFSKDPMEKSNDVVVEAVYGLGEGIVSGRIEPDHYVVDRELVIKSRKIAEKKVAIVRSSEGKTTIVKLTEERARQQVLSEYEVKKLADYALKLEEHYKKPQDIEFAISANEIYIVQTRPITTLGNQKKEEKIDGREILSGLAASPGIGSGEVKVVYEMEDLEKVRKGDILVTEMTNPDMVVSMQKAAGIITDEGGSTCHAAIVSREMGIPAVVGTKKATKILKDGMKVTVDGFNGKVYEGEIETLKARKVEIKPIIQTKTKIKVIVDLPDFAERAAETHSKYVGLTRIEGIIAESGRHPNYFLRNNEINKYEDLLFKEISRIAQHFDELWIRTSDIRSDEYRHLKGASEKIELNPMLGMHGIRYGVKNPAILRAEIKALAKIADTGKRMGIMMPQIIDVSEVRVVKRIMQEEKIDNLILGVMIETPAAVQIIEELCKEGIKFISFGTNDLTQFTLALDRGNEDVQYLYNELHPSVLRQLAYVISVCRKYNVESSICGQAGSNEKMVDFLVKHGIDSISVNADKAYDISVYVKNMEDKGLRGSEHFEGIEGDEVKLVNKKEVENKAEVLSQNKKEKFVVNCGRCSKMTEVPFRPDGVRPVYCKICLEVVKQEKLAHPENNIANNIKEGIKEEVKEIAEKVEEKIEKAGEIIKKDAEIVKEKVIHAEEAIAETARKVEEKIKEEFNQKKKDVELDDLTDEEIEKALDIF